MNIDEMKKQVKSMITPKRYEHSLLVAEEAVKLAKHYGAITSKAETAGILHDCAKDIHKDQALSLFSKYGLVIDDITLNEQKLIHAPLGACIAQIEFGIIDTEILDAIWFHTTAKPNMSMMSKIIYVADFIEPSRDFSGVNELRAMAYQNLDNTVLAGVNYTINEIISQNKLVHPDSLHARNYLVLSQRRKADGKTDELFTL